MKAFLSLCKVGHKSQRLGWPSLSFPGNTSTVPSLIDLAAARAMSTFAAKKSHYEVLGVTRSASTAEIRQAFLKLSKQCHPDTNAADPNNHKKFVLVNEAYSILSKPLSRRDYDLTLDAERYAARHMNATAYRSHAYGYRPEAGHYYHYRGHSYEEPNWRTDYEREQGVKSVHLFNLSMITACITCAAVALILHYMHRYIPNPRHNGLRKNLTSEDIEKHDLIMTSEHEGMTVYYYAVPKAGDPKNYEVLAVHKKQVKDSDAYELHELNMIKYADGKTEQN